jgi:hypothetical protein
MKMFIRVLGIGLFLSMLQAAPANATIINFAAELLGSTENPVNASTATGSIFVTLDDVLDTLTVHETFSGLTGGIASGAHIHCCAGPGVNASVVVNFIGKGFPLAASGTYDHTFNLLTDLSAAITLDAFLNGLENGQAYANIHNTLFPGGEIRGQLARVPEPATLLLFVFGIGLVGFAKRKRVEGPTTLMAR